MNTYVFRGKTKLCFLSSRLKEVPHLKGYSNVTNEFLHAIGLHLTHLNINVFSCAFFDSLGDEDDSSRILKERSHGKKPVNRLSGDVVHAFSKCDPPCACSRRFLVFLQMELRANNVHTLVEYLQRTLSPERSVRLNGGKGSKRARSHRVQYGVAISFQPKRFSNRSNGARTILDFFSTCSKTRALTRKFSFQLPNGSKHSAQRRGGIDVNVAVVWRARGRNGIVRARVSNEKEICAVGKR